MSKSKKNDFQRVNTILSIIGLVIIGISMYTSIRVGYVIAGIFGVQQLIFSFNYSRMNKKNESVVSLALGMFLIVLAAMMKVN